MQPDPVLDDDEDIFDTPDDAAMRQGEADYEAGHYVTHEEMSAWLRTWGTPDFRPMPRPWLE